MNPPQARRYAPRCARTVETPLRDWLPLVEAQAQRARSEDVDRHRPAGWLDLMALGIADADVVALPGYHPMYVISLIRDFERLDPALPVRAVLGWVLLGSQVPGTAMGAVLACDWEFVRPGLAALGWAYAAAGFSPEETVALLDRGEAVDEEVLRTMAALRGSRVPAG